MQIKKIKQSNNYIFDHCDRTDGKAYNTTSDIDPARSHLNFNVAENNRHRREQLLYIREQTHKPVRSNAVSCFALVLTLPKNYAFMKNDIMTLRSFFSDAYVCIRDFFGLKDSDIASSWVHMDETTPHMHFLGTPLWRENGNCSLFYDKVIPREKYRTYHPVIEQMMREKGWNKIELLNGATRDGNLTVQQLKAKTLKEKNDALEQTISSLSTEQDRLNASIQGLFKFQKDLEKEKEMSFVLQFYERYEQEIFSFLLNAEKTGTLPKDLSSGLRQFLSTLQKEQQKEKNEKTILLSDGNEIEIKDKENENGRKSSEREGNERDQDCSDP